MKRVLLFSALLLPVFLLSGCGGVDPMTALAVIGLLFVLGVVGKRDAAPVDMTPLGEAQIQVSAGRGNATLHLKETSRTDIPAVSVPVSGTASKDGTFDLSGKLPDGTVVRIAGKDGDIVRLTVGTKTTEHSSIRQSKG